ncbi:hypothetical protein EVA_02484 [gut metagenome]|uniref:Uncharacterized protein n=1 Tax=gut metagenome TaxID=749906 RepID=J9H5V8_9ZZZZ
MHCVFHSIRFKVNKVGIQWYPFFYTLTSSLEASSPLFRLFAAGISYTFHSVFPQKSKLKTPFHFPTFCRDKP